MSGKLYLIPNTLGGDDPELVIPGKVLQIMKELDHFIVENERNARRFLIKCGYEKKIDAIRFFILNKHTRNAEKTDFLNPCLKGTNMGIISEAGVPGVADPGSDIVSMAHKRKIKTIPLTGPSSVILSLMASGLNGQQFTFHGYLPVKPHERKQKIKFLESEAKKTKSTQIFIETPYRNDALFNSLKEICNQNTLLCLACDISLSTEYIKTMKISEWKKQRVDLKKRPCIFLLA
ncbi:MAG: SAM-dependent methyltransferase [Bacteroidota bacterium]